MTSVDPVEAARRRYTNASIDSANGRMNRPYGDPDLRWNELRAAILASDPRVQALEAVARAVAEAAPEDRISEVSVDLPSGGYPRSWLQPAALAALQEVPGRGEDGE